MITHLFSILCYKTQLKQVFLIRKNFTCAVAKGSFRWIDWQKVWVIGFLATWAVLPFFTYFHLIFVNPLNIFLQILPNFAEFCRFQKSLWTYFLNYPFKFLQNSFKFLQNLQKFYQILADSSHPEFTCPFLDIFLSFHLFSKKISRNFN